MKGQVADFSLNSWRSHKLKRVVKATLGSEALAMDDALAEVEWIRALWHELLDPSSCVLDGSQDFEIASIRVRDHGTGAHVTDAKACLICSAGGQETLANAAERRSMSL